MLFFFFYNTLFLEIKPFLRRVVTSYLNLVACRMLRRSAWTLLLEVLFEEWSFQWNSGALRVGKANGKQGYQTSWFGSNCHRKMMTVIRLETWALFFCYCGSLTLKVADILEGCGGAIWNNRIICFDKNSGSLGCHFATFEFLNLIYLSTKKN